MKHMYLAQKFWREGYLVLPEFFSPARMRALQSAILDHYGSQPDFAHTDEFLEKAATEVVPWFPQKEGPSCFDQVEQDPGLQALSEAILGEGWQSLYCMAMFSKSGTKGQAWHQDCPPEDPKKFNLNRLVYSMDIDQGTGGQVIIRPRSHRMGPLSVGDVNEDFADQIVLSPSRGTLVLIHGHTWHRVLPVTGAYRVSTNFRAIPADTDEDITDICVYRNMRYQFSTSRVLEERC